MKNQVLAAWLGAALSTTAPAASDSTSLAGQWQFELDRRDTGIQERWFDRDLVQRLQLPGALQNQGFGDDISVQTDWTGASNVETWSKGKQYQKYRQPGNIKVPFCLQPEKHYVGVAWYQRDIEVPGRWQGKRLLLRLERVHWGISSLAGRQCPGGQRQPFDAASLRFGCEGGAGQTSAHARGINCVTAPNRGSAGVS